MPGHGLADPLLLEALFSHRKCRFAAQHCGGTAALAAFSLFALFRVFVSPIGQHLSGSVISMASEAPEHETDELAEFVTGRSGVRMPRLIYKVAYHGGGRQKKAGKKNSTDGIILSAVRAGVRGLDTAGLPLDQYESGINAALAGLFSSGVARETLFIQTKVNLQYAAESNPGLPISKQLDLSITNSLSSLGLDYLDSLVLESPYREHEQTLEAWRAMERAVRSGLVRQLGIWNVASLAQLSRIYTDAKVKPMVANFILPFQAETGQEQMIRAWCAERGIYVQSAWALEFLSMERVVANKTIQELAWKYKVAPSILLARHAMSLGIVPIISMDREYKEYLSAWRLPLTARDAETIDCLLTQWRSEEEKTSAETNAIEDAGQGESWEDRPICRFCFEGESETAAETGALIAPCACSGGQEFVHLNCLRLWQRTVFMSQPAALGQPDAAARMRVCNVCQSEFNCSPPTPAQLVTWEAERTRAQVLLTAADTGDTATIMGLVQTLSEGQSEEALLLARDNDGNTPLHLAARNGNLNVAQDLLGAASAQLQSDMLVAQNNDGRTPVSAPECFRVSRQPDVLAETVFWRLRQRCNSVVRALLHVASEGQRRHMILRHILLGRDFDGSIPLHWAAFSGHTSTAKALLSAVPEPLVSEMLLTKDQDGATPLHQVALEGHEGTAKALLLAAPSEALQQDMLLAKVEGEGAYTPLHIAAWEGHTSIAHVLVETPSSEALQRRMLFAQAEEGETPLHLASCKGHEATAEALLSNASESLQRELLLATDYEGYAPLHWAAHSGTVEVVMALLEGAPKPLQCDMLMARNRFGTTPLHIAVKNHRDDVARALLRCASEPLQQSMLNAKNRFGHTPLQVADDNFPKATLAVQQLPQHGRNSTDIPKRDANDENPFRSLPQDVNPDRNRFRSFSSVSRARQRVRRRERKSLPNVGQGSPHQEQQQQQLLP